jgi:hypothetical protein
MKTYVFLERRFSPPLEPADVLALAAGAAGCFGMHRVNWRHSLLSSDGSRMLCSFDAPDMESARIAMRQSDVDTTNFWRGNIQNAPNVGPQDMRQANVLVERSFDAAVELSQIQDLEDAGLRCLEIRRVRFLRTFFSFDRKRMICLYAAPDAESVRQAQVEAGVPFDEAWAFQLIEPSATPT